VSVPSLPPGPHLPRTLQTLGWMLRPGPFMERCRARYGDVFTMRIRNEGTWVFLADPELIKQVFTGDPRVLRAGEANAVLRPIVGSASVLLLDEPAHMTDRRLMLPPFHGERMQRYGELMAEVTRAELERWPQDEAFPLWPSMQAITLEVIMRAVFGITEPSRLARVRELLRHMLDWTTNPRQLAYLALMGPRRVERNRDFRAVMDPVDDALLAEIARRRRAPDLAEREDIMSMLLQARYEDGSAMDDRELRDELMTLLVAGHETTATSLAWAFERLVRHPQQLDRLYAETQAGGEEYLDAVVKETLRLRPVLPIVVRRLAEPMQFGDHLIPAGVSVTPCIYLVHRRADIYPDPLRFAPERFLEQPAGTYTWIPFGGGVRRCLGASFALFEMKVVLRTVIENIDLRAQALEPEHVVRRAITLTPGHRATVLAARRRAPAADTAGEPAVQAVTG
jgi:cytochrome P450 family 135